MPLSAETVQGSTLEYVGWSPVPGLAFFYNSELQIYEGGRDDQYLARFELWFVPESGAPERKLAHLRRRVSGWER